MADVQQPGTWRPASAQEPPEPTDQPAEADPSAESKPGAAQTAWRPGPVKTESSTKFRTASSSNNTAV